MTTLREAAQQAQQAMEPYADIKPRDWKTDREKLWRSYDVLRAALAEQPAEQEPVAWCDQYEGHIDGLRHYSDGGAREIPLYAAPQPKREPLTDEDIDQVTDTQWESNNHKPIYAAHRAYARAIERAHGIGGQP